ncbi:unnamed protein product [Prorocentrum cordatum]|uniref:MIF4G domain-containing protein n=1 Tax=Prorocentrum cordatum TaxID=2364126 RepID=A0ABN9SQW4_9DINO|nr:unnamed protein product [Polarella glacialis]
MARPGGAPRTDDAKDGDGPGGGDKLSSSRAIAALDFNPPDKVFEKVLMLRIRRALRDDPPMLTSLKVSSRPEEKTPTAGDARNKHGRPEREADRRPLVGQDFKSYSKKKTDQGGSGGGAGGMSVKSITTGKGYKITEPVKREEDIERRVRALLNKICPDNLKIIVDQLAGVDLHKAEELEHVIRIIFSKALAEPHYCETYADMVFSLRSRYPEFPPEHEDEKAHSFTRILLNTVQNEFENLPTTFEPTEEDKQSYSADDLRLEIGKKKAKVLANMKFIGNLFLRQLLAVKVIGQVVHDLIGIKETPIEEHMIECVCELLKAIGYSLDNTPHGKMLVTQFSHRLMDLKKEMDPTTGRSLFSKRIQFQIQDLIDLRGRNWQQKLFKEQAKTKDEVRKDAAKEAYKTAKSGPEAMFATQVAGMRPSYIEELKSDRSQPGRRQVHEHQRGQFDQVHVRRCFQYYAEERKPKDLQDEWMKPQPTKEQAKQGMEWLCEIGFNDAEKEDIVAETVVQLVAQLKIVHWEILKEALAPMLDTLEDVAIDVPTAPKFVHSLYARFIHTCGRDFNTTLLKILPLKDKDGSVMVWDLLVGILKRLKQIGGPQGTTLVRKALDMKEFQDAACGAKKCEPSQVNQLFRSAGVQA